MKYTDKIKPMTPEQSENRAEREAIMCVDGGCTPEQAQKYMDRYPIAYGRRDTEQQDELFKEV